MIYKWRVPIYPNVSAQSAGERIEELEKQHGSVTPQILLDDSRPKEAVLHPCYEWDDSVAAEKYRLYQSKKIVGNIVTVTVSEEKQAQEPIRAYVSINNRNEQGVYVSSIKALSDEDTREVVLENARSELRAFIKKYKGLVNVVELLEEVIADETL